MAKRLTQGTVKKNTHVRSAPDQAQKRASLAGWGMRAIFVVMLAITLITLIRPETLKSLQERFALQIGARHNYGGLTRGDATLASFFAPEVLYWKENIIRWGHERQLNPNLIATVIQIESCGDPFVSSGAGAQGLFQVMPLHFDDGENQVNPERNAQNGLDHMVDCLRWTNYDIGVSFACYNGGPSVINLPRNQWYAESQNYYKWGMGIYGDAIQGKEVSPTLNEWLGAGGSNLCARARQTQTQIMPYLVDDYMTVSQTTVE